MLGFTAAQSSYDNMLPDFSFWDRIEHLSEIYADEIEADFLENYLHDFLVENCDHLSDDDFFDLVSIEFSKCDYWYELVEEYSNANLLAEAYEECTENFIIKMDEENEDY